MQIIEYFQCVEKEKWIAEIENCDWSAAKFLSRLLKENKFESTLGGEGKIFLMVDGEEIVSFATLTHQDCIEDETLFPWIGFVYTAPPYRGCGYCGKVIEHACEEARNDGHNTVYLATDHIGLYEKYGFVYMENRQDVWGEDDRIYYKELDEKEK